MRVVLDARRIHHVGQGKLVFEDAYSVHQEVGFEGVFAAKTRSGLIEAAGEIEGHAADGVQRAGGVAGAGAAGVVAQADVQHMEAAVLEMPAAAQVIQEEGRVGFRA